MYSVHGTLEQSVISFSCIGDHKSQSVRYQAELPSPWTGLRMRVFVILTKKLVKLPWTNLNVRSNKLLSIDQ